MKPRKESGAGYILAAIALLMVILISINAGMAWTDVKVMEATQGIQVQGIDGFSQFINCFERRLAEDSLSFVLNDNVKTALIWGVFLWFIVVAYLFNSQKKYIAGKEYGTAKWGTQKDISDLFAVNIAKKEIRQAKQVRTPIGRFFVRMRILRTCKKNIVDTTSLKEAFREAWKPEKLRYQYQAELKEINDQYEQRIVITTKEEKEEKQKEAREYYQKALKDFYNGKDKIERIKAKYQDADALLTKTEHVSIYNYVLNNNILILGGTGSGKTRGFVLPNVMQAHSSFVITDPKGEILEKVGYFLETIKGYKIRVLNLDDKMRSDGYNPFVYIHPERPGYEERVLSLIEAIIINTDGGEKKGGSDPFWDKAERLFLQAIFFFVCDGFPPEEQTMNTVQALIKMLQIAEEEDNRDSDLDHFVEIFKEKYGEDHIGVQQYEEFRGKASGKTAKSIVISAVARLAPFKTKEVRRIFSYDTMQLDRLGEEKTAVFVVVPPTDTTFNFIAGILFTQMFQELQYCATQIHKHDGQRVPVPVRFILDEFANTCTIPQFVKILAYARSFGIGIVPILQSLEQIKNMYKDEWGVIVDNCNTLLYLGSITHMDTLEYMSKLLGKGTYDKKTTGRTRGRSGSSSQNFDVIGRDLMDTSEIRKLPKKDCLLIIGGRNPFYSEKYDYESHPNYKYTSDANPVYSYEYTAPKPPTTKEQIANEINHRDNKMEERVTARVNTIMERVDKEIDEIQMNINPQSLLSHIGKSFKSFEPIREELLKVDDGSEEVDEKMILDALSFDEEDKRIDDILKNVRKKVDEANERIERSMSESEYILITEPQQVAQRAIAAGVSNLVPIRDEVLNVNSGESTDEEALDEFQFDSEDENIEDIIDEDIGDLEGLIANIAEELANDEFNL